MQNVRLLLNHLSNAESVWTYYRSFIARLQGFYTYSPSQGRTAIGIVDLTLPGDSEESLRQSQHSDLSHSASATETDKVEVSRPRQSDHRRDRHVRDVVRTNFAVAALTDMAGIGFRSARAALPESMFAWPK